MKTLLKVQRPKSKVQSQILTFAVLLWTLDTGPWTVHAQLPTNHLAPSASAVMAGTNGLLTTPANFFGANSNAIKAAVGTATNLNATNLTGVVAPANGGLGFANTNLVPSGAMYDDGTSAFSSDWGAPTYALTVVPGQTYFVYVPGNGASNDQGWAFADQSQWSGASSALPATSLVTPNTNVLYLWDNNPSTPVRATVTMVSSHALAISPIGGTFAGALDPAVRLNGSQLTGTVIASQLSGATAGNFVVTNTGSAPMLLLNVPPSAQTTSTIDYMTVVASPTPFSSGCGGWFFPMFSTNHVMHGITGDQWSTLPDGTHVYLIDAKAGQINCVGEQFTRAAINWGCWGIFENPTWNYYEGSTSMKSTITGQLGDWFFEDYYTNATLHWPALNPPGATNADPRLAPGGLGSWDAMTLNEFTRVLTGFYLTAGGTNIASTNQFQVNTPHGTNSFAVGTNGIAYASVAVSAPTVTIANAPTMTATNATPGDVTITSGVISTAPAIWITITNNGIAYSIPAYK